MPNVTVGADAATTSRRLFLAGGSVAAVFATLRQAKSNPLGGDDVYAAIRGLAGAAGDYRAACARLAAIEDAFVQPEYGEDLYAKTGDLALFRGLTREGELLSDADMQNARLTHLNLRPYVDSPVELAQQHYRGLEAWDRTSSILKAHKAWEQACADARDRLGMHDAEEAIYDNREAVVEARTALLALRPRTVAGLRAVVSALSDTEDFEEEGEFHALVELMLGAPALAGEV